MDNKQLTLPTHPTQVRVILEFEESEIRIASAIFPKEGVFCMGGWINKDECRLLLDSEAEPLIQANPFQLASLVTEKHIGLKFQTP